jgi:hypothetical protein
MSLPARIFAGDLARALSAAGDAEGANWPAIAAMLGFHFEAGRDPDADRRPAEPSIAYRPAEPVSGPAAADTAAAAAEGEMGDLLDFEMEQFTAPPEPIPADAPSLPQSEAARPLAASPLFNALWERGVLLEAAGTPRREGELAIIEAVELIARGEGWRDLPFEKIQSVAKGCQILVDTGLGMQPFAGDTRQVVRSFRHAVGAEHIRVLTFVDCPTRGVLSETYRDETYRAPDSGATVVAITDLCSGGPRAAIREAQPEAWLAIAKRVRDAAASFIVLNPYPPDRWPASLADRMPIVHWHVATRSADVRRTRRRFRS